MDTQRNDRRTPGPEITARRRANLLVAPFVCRFEGWNTRVAHLAALLTARMTTDAERQAAKGERARLASEVRDVQLQFATVMKDEQHSRFVEVDASFRRLLQLLQD